MPGGLLSWATTGATISTPVLVAILIIYTKQNKDATEENNDLIEETQGEVQEAVSRLDTHELLIDRNASDLEDIEEAAERNRRRVERLQTAHVNEHGADGLEPYRGHDPNDPPRHTAGGGD